MNTVNFNNINKVNIINSFRDEQVRSVPFFIPVLHQHPRYENYLFIGQKRHSSLNGYRRAVYGNSRRFNARVFRNWSLSSCPTSNQETCQKSLDSSLTLWTKLRVNSPMHDGTFFEEYLCFRSPDVF
jgi:hypothetical protein